ncbi:MAG: TonB-dependent receptor plug domain-containing protein [Opitutales bacterium]
MLIGPALAAQDDTEDFTDFSLEELLEVEIYTASKKAEPLFTVPSASYVLDADDIAATGATHIADALRVVPGVNVASLDSYRWAVSVRGFNNVFNNSLLTLIDGRVLFNSTFAGTFWGELDILLDNIQAIEVVRGPGGAVWGANAVNGVINVISKPTKETQGALLKTRIGTEERTLAARYGGKLENHEAYYRIWAKYSDYDEFENPAGPDFGSYQSWQGGARIDWELQNGRSFVLEVGGYQQEVDDLFTVLQTDVIHNVEAFHVAGTWIHEPSADRQREIRTYFTFNDADAFSDLRVTEYRYDLQYQQSMSLGNRHELTFGAGYRLDWDDTRGNLLISVEPTEDSRHTFNVFVQDRFTVIPDKLFAIGGFKFEYHSFVGPVYQPDAKLLFTPTQNQTYWASVAHAVRVPTRADRALRGFAAGFPPIPLMSDVNVQEESVTSYEVGGRVRLKKKVSFDAAAFFSTYQDLIGPTTIMGVRTSTDVGDADTYGFEIGTDYVPFEELSFRGAYSLWKSDFDGDPLARASFEAQETKSPEQQFSLLTTWQPVKQLELSSVLRYYDQLENAPGVAIDSYLQADLRAAWRPSDSVEISVVGRNLLDASQQETFMVNTAIPVEVPREVYVQATFEF